MKKKKLKLIKQCTALGIAFVFFSALVVVTIIDSAKKTPEIAE